MVETIIKRGLKVLVKNGVTLKRDDWIEEAEVAERSGSPVTSRAIIQCALEIGVEEDERERIWLQDLEQIETRNSLITSRAVVEKLIEEFPNRKNIWLRALDFEKKHGTPTKVEALLRNSVTKCPHTEEFWLLLAKYKWQS